VDSLTALFDQSPERSDDSNVCYHLSTIGECSPVLREHLHVAPDCSPAQVDELLALFNNEFRRTVALTLKELGCTHLESMRIVELPHTVPCAAKPFRQSMQKREELKNILQ